MIFKDRVEAAEELAALIQKDPDIKENLADTVIVSLLRGGVVLGNTLAQKLKISHFPLVVSKIPAPNNPELAIGALCGKYVYLEKKVIEGMIVSKKEINQMVNLAKKKQKKYLKNFSLENFDYGSRIRNRYVILTDDGVATGATIKVAYRFLKSKNPKKMILAVPVAPLDFNIENFDRIIILHKDPFFFAVSQFYQSFPEVNDKEVRKIIR